MLGNPLWVTNVADFTPTLEYHSGSNTVSVKQQQQSSLSGTQIGMSLKQNQVMVEAALQLRQ